MAQPTRSTYGALAFSSRTRLIGKGSSGSRPCENSRTFSHAPVLFAFSSPEPALKRKKSEKFRSARPAADYRRVLTQPRSKAVGPRPIADRLKRADSGPTAVASG